MKKIDQLKALLRVVEERRSYLDNEAERLNQQGEHENEYAMCGEANGLWRGVEILDELIVALREVVK